MLYKSLEFKNASGQKIKIIEIPVLELNNRYYFMVQVRLQGFMESLYHQPREKGCYSFRDYLKQKMKWPDFKKLYSIREFKNHA